MSIGGDRRRQRRRRRLASVHTRASTAFNGDSPNKWSNILIVQPGCFLLISYALHYRRTFMCKRCSSNVHYVRMDGTNVCRKAQCFCTGFQQADNVFSMRCLFCKKKLYCTFHFTFTRVQNRTKNALSSIALTQRPPRRCAQRSAAALTATMSSSRQRVSF